MAIKTRVTGIATLVLICMLWLTPRNNARALMSSTSKLQLQSQLSHQNPTSSVSTAPTAPLKPTDRPLILYAYSESSSARENLKFFIAHGLHASADFIFIFNGETDAQRLLPNATNIEFIGRENKCWDLGAYAEVLKKNDRWKKYKRFIMLNASIRGPFMPHWAGACWSDRYLSKVTEKVKLVGMTMNCWPNPHVQSMIWATDSLGLNLLLHPPPTTPNPGTWLPRMPTVAGWQEAQNDPTFPSNIQIGMDNCPETYYEAIAVEVGATSVIRGAGYEVDAMLARFHSKEEYIEKCDVNKSEDMLYEKGYEGTNIHPFETIFIKTNRDIDPLMIEQYTKWTDGARYSSYEFC